jgi:hypothetical protein
MITILYSFVCELASVCVVVNREKTKEISVKLKIIRKRKPNFCVCVCVRALIPQQKTSATKIFCPVINIIHIHKNKADVADEVNVCHFIGHDKTPRK